ncbi:MAG TPA: hypothetical protein VG826_19360 [Pirellulales bacterium]|nr:hypothetical protein [Pirellulales bacterium]
MRLATLFLLTLMMLACRGSSAWGQYGWPGFYGGYASTAGEGFAIGMADMVRATGMATLMGSMAASNVEDARSKYIDNQMKATQGYIDRQRMLQSYQASLRRPPPTSEQLYRLAQQGLPKSLTATQLDPVTGKITWPVVLRDEPFDSYRESAQAFFHEAVANPQTFTYESYNQLREAGAECLAELKSRLKDYNPNDYIQAKKFVESLTYAAQQL